MASRDSGAAYGTGPSMPYKPMKAATEKADPWSSCVEHPSVKSRGKGKTMATEMAPYLAKAKQDSLVCICPHD